MHVAQPTVYRIVPSGRISLCVDQSEFADVRDPTELPVRPINALLQDAQGYLWLGSEHGPLLYDGLFCGARQALEPLRECIVHAFCLTDSRTLWVGTLGTGLARLQVGSTSGPRLACTLTHAHGLPDNAVRALCADGRGRLWAGTQNGVAVIDRETVVRVMGEADGLPSPRVNGLASDLAGRVWIGTEGGLVVAPDDAACHRVPIPEVETCMVRYVYRDPRGRIWAGLAGGGLYCAGVSGGDESEQPVLVHRFGSTVHAICMDDQERLWVGTRKGAYVLVDGHLQDTFTTRDGLPSDVVLALHHDRQGRVWASTHRGIAILSGPRQPVSSLSGTANPDHRLAWCFADDRRGSLWIGTEAGIVVVDGENERVAALPDLPPMLLQMPVFGLLFDQCGQVWASVRRRGLFCLDAVTGAVRAHLLADREVSGLAMCLVDSRLLWLGTSQHGLMCIDVETRRLVRELGPADGLPDVDIHGLQLDAQGHLWACTASHRLVCVDPIEGCILDSIDLGGEAAPHLLQDLALDTHGLLWACSYGGGLICVDPRRRSVVSTITMADGLRSDLVYTCRVDARGYLWLGTGCGVTRFAPWTLQCVTVDQSLGLPHNECDSNALHLDTRGRLWVGTAKGVGIVETTLIPDDVPPCSVYLTGFFVMGTAREPMDDMVLEDTEYDLEFEYGAVSFAAPAQVVYRVQLMGLEAGWSAPSMRRRQRYMNLRPGAYIFRVAACNWGGNWSTPFEVRFRVVRNRQAQEAEEALERERIDKEVFRATAARLTDLNRRLAETDRLKTELLERTQAQVAAAEDLAQLRSSFVAAVSHELRSPLTAIVGYAELLQAHWSQLPDDDRLTRIRRIVDAANRQKYLVEQLLIMSRLEITTPVPTVEPTRIQSVVERAADEVRTGYRGQLIWLEGPPNLDMMADPERAVQILVNLLDNAAKYSPDGAPIEVSWAAEEVQAVVRVRDHGRGVPVEGREHLFTRFGRVPGSRIRAGRVGTGLGLYLGRSFAQAMHGELALERTGPSGSVFCLKLPLAAAQSSCTAPD